MKRTVRDLKNIKGKRILVRCDFNVPLDNYGDILDDSRIVATLPTLTHLSKHGAKLIVCSHLGRPNGYDKYLSLFPVAVYLMKCFPNKVKFCGKVVGPEVEDAVAKLKDGEILVLENLRFHPGEEENSADFAQKLASLAELYVDDAFGVAHRKHASNYGVALKLPSAIGYCIEKELQVFGQAFEKPQRPFVAIFGGAKVSDKLKLINNVIDKADSIIIGGGMAYTFLQAKGYNIGDSIVDLDLVDDARDLMQVAEEKGVKILLPIDHMALIAEKDKAVKTEILERGMVGFDIGPKTIKMFANEIANAKQILWNGPVGKVEDDRFKKGTTKIAKAVAKSQAYSVVGGGDSLSAINQVGVSDKINHLSTGGGASLKLMEGKVLAAIDVIDSI
ncbi:MAG: phosphoglycerate kinase [Clostridia bacterium]|nr:phosphoglycerate kinase [Clostridia bacterium]